MKKIICACIAALAFSVSAGAATLTGDVPTTRANDEPLPRAELGSIKIYKDAATTPTAVLTGTAIAGATFSYSVPSCAAATYTATAVDTGGLESERSASAQVIPVAVQCRPKSPTARITAP